MEYILYIELNSIDSVWWKPIENYLRQISDRQVNTLTLKVNYFVKSWEWGLKDNGPPTSRI